MTCWNCQADTQRAPFCPACGKVAPRAPDATHFDTFGLPRQVEVDVGALEKRYRELSLKLHPDRLAGAQALERRLSLEQTAALNEGLRTLKDPTRRLFYLLRLEGVDLEREEGGGRPQLPMDFLEEVMALREELEEAREGRDLARAQAMASEVKRRQDAALAEARAALSARLANASDAAARERAVHALGRARYFSRFLEEVAAMEEEALG